MKNESAPSNDCVVESVPPPFFECKISGDGQTLMVITHTLSLDDFTKVFTTIRTTRAKIVQFDYAPSEYIKISRELLSFLDSHTTGDKKKLLKCSEENKNNSDMAKFVTGALTNNSKILTSFSQSRPYRLRYSVHPVLGINFVVNLLKENNKYKRAFDSLIAKADESEKYRLYDLKNETEIKSFEGINKKAAEFAICQKPESLTHFIEYYQFFKSWALEIRENLELATKSAVKKEELKAEVVKRTFNQIENGGELVVKLLTNSINAAEQIGVGVSNGIHRVNIKAFAAHLKFKSSTNLAYHVLKHFKELPETIQNQPVTNLGLEISHDLQDIFRQTFIYLKTAREVIEKGEVEVRPCQFQIHRESLIFTAEIEGKKIQTFVHLANGEAVIATCFPVFT